MGFFLFWLFSVAAAYVAGVYHAEVVEYLKFCWAWIQQRKAK